MHGAVTACVADCNVMAAMLICVVKYNRRDAKVRCMEQTNSAVVYKL